jgi:hypothetical protein
MCYHGLGLGFKPLTNFIRFAAISIFSKNKNKKQPKKHIPSNLVLFAKQKNKRTKEPKIKNK